jgi:predicted Zn-dependent protease with MMP-like domain
MPKHGSGYAAARDRSAWCVRQLSYGRPVLDGARDKERGTGIRVRAFRTRRYGRPVPDNGPVLEMTREEFEELVAEALDRIPPELTRLMDNVAVFVEDEPPATDPELLGLYEGTPLTERGEWYAGVLPDRITVYRGPTLRMCTTREEVVAESEVTVVHEIAHHFGIDDERLHALGYG